MSEGKRGERVLAGQVYFLPWSQLSASPQVWAAPSSPITCRYSMSSMFSSR